MRPDKTIGPFDVRLFAFRVNVAPGGRRCVVEITHANGARAQEEAWGGLDAAQRALDAALQTVISLAATSG